MKFDLENSPWAVVLMAALFFLVLITLLVVVLVVVDPKADTDPLVAVMGVWSTIVISALGVGAFRARRRNGTTDKDADSDE